MANRIPFGVKAKDKITGFEGTVTGHSDFITGCDQYHLQPTVDEKGLKREGQWFDENRIEGRTGKACRECRECSRIQKRLRRARKAVAA